MVVSRIGSGVAFLAVSGAFFAHIACATSQTSANHKGRKPYHAEQSAVAASSDAKDVANAATDRRLLMVQPPGAEFDVAKSANGETRVLVLNGDQRTTQVFRSAEPSDDRSSKTAHRRAAKAASAKQLASSSDATEVEIINGTQREKRLVSGPALLATSSAQGHVRPVVIGVSEWGSRNAQGKVQPVVVGIEEGNTQQAANAMPVVIGITAPKPEVEDGDGHPFNPEVAPEISPANAQGVQTRPRRRPYRPVRPSSY
jgi:hypothetical protein